MTADDGWPTDEEICALATNEDIPFFVEAYEIARQYNRISRALSVQLLGTENLNWCGFAQWSSKAVGDALRGNGDSLFMQELRRLYHVPPLLERPFRLVMLILLGASYSIGMSTANRSIFVEMASFHTQILSGAEKVTVLHVDASDAGHCLLDDLGHEGLELLRTARDLLRRVGSISGEIRSELILGANIALSAYEQKRVQPALEYAFYRGIRFLLQVSWRMPYYYLKGAAGKRKVFYARSHRDQTSAMQWIEDRWARMYSRTLWLKTAVDTVMLSKPLIFPGRSPSLLRAAATFKSPEVAALVQRYGPADPGALKGVANWLDYDERMRFIVAYFMGYQQITQMFDEPHFRPRRPCRKSQLTEPFSELTFRSVTL